jgi:hypothetical protein
MNVRATYATATRRFDRSVVTLMDSIGIPFARSALGLVFI